MRHAPAWRLTGVAVALLTPLLLLPTVAMLLQPAYADTTSSSAGGATIDHAQPSKEGLRMLVSVPASAGATDLAKVSVTIGGTKVTSTAVAAERSNAIKRVSILAIDTSLSMRGARITEAKRAANTYLRTAPANVAVGVVTFDDKVTLLVEPSLRRAAALTAVAGLTLTRNTALYDGVLGALDALGPASAVAGQRRVLVLSDGKDTTDTPLDDVVSRIDSSGAVVDVVSLQQSDSESGPLRQIAGAGKGTVLDASKPEALTAAFAAEADALARQVLVTAAVPRGAGQNADVAVVVPGRDQTVTASAYLPLRSPGLEEAAQAAAAAPVPTAAPGVGFVVDARLMTGGAVALGLGLVGVVVALGMRRPAASSDGWLGEQVSAYGPHARQLAKPDRTPAGGLVGQAKGAAERALANNRSFEARLESKLDTAGSSFKPSEWILLQAGVAVGAGLVGIVVGAGNIVLGLLFVVAGVVGPAVYLKFKRASRLRAFGAGLADTLQLMSGSLSAGLSLAQSIDTIVREGNEPVASEFRRVIVESRLGVPLEDCLEGVAQRMESKDWEWVVMAIRIQREVGGNLAELLLQVADTLRERDYLRRHVRALSAEGRLSCYILGALPPGFLVFLTLTKPDYVYPLYHTPLGYILLAAIVVLLGVGVLWMSKVSKVEL